MIMGCATGTALEKPSVVVRLSVIDESITRGAIPPNLERGAARVVPRGFRLLLGMPHTPTREEAKRSDQFGAFGSEHVRSSRRTIRIRPSHHQSISLQPLEPLGQDIGRNARNLIEQLIEPTRAAQQRFDDE
jgi:hypothetical protein